MRYVFIVNPKTHATEQFDRIQQQIERLMQQMDTPYRIATSTHVGNVGEIAAAEAAKGGSVRIYGFGGDGTLNELVKGCAPFDNVEVGIFPMGSGNDYVKTFGDIAPFLDFERQLQGESIPVDLIETLEGHAINICSVGYDAEVGYRMKAYKNLPLVSGPRSYDIAVLRSLMGRLGEYLSVTVHTEEGQQHFRGRYLFVLAASGKYYGGGYKAAPFSIPNDGLLDFILIKVPSITKFLALVGDYKKGTHLTDPKFEHLVTFIRGTSVEIVGQKPFYCSRDGEITAVRRESFSVVPQKLRFILPKGVIFPPSEGEI